MSNIIFGSLITFLYLYFIILAIVKTKNIHIVIIGTIFGGMIIYCLTFDPIIQYITKEKNNGYSQKR